MKAFNIKKYLWNLENIKDTENQTLKQMNLWEKCQEYMTKEVTGNQKITTKSLMFFFLRFNATLHLTPFWRNSYFFLIKYLNLFSSFLFIFLLNLFTSLMSLYEILSQGDSWETMQYSSLKLPLLSLTLHGSHSRKPTLLLGLESTTIPGYTTI